MMRNGDALAIAGLAAHGYHQQREMPVNVECIENGLKPAFHIYLFG